MRKRSKLLLSLIVMWTLSCKEKVKQDNQQSAMPFHTTENIVEKKENTSHKSTQDTLISKETVFKINSDFNNYKTKYSIEVLKNTSDKDAYDQLHFNLPVGSTKEILCGKAMTI